MADFKVIETQEQLNEVIGERLKRAEEKANAAAAEKYADYDSLKEKNAELTNQVEAFSQQIQELQEASAKNEQLIKEGAKYKTDLEKTKIALNAGLRIEYADRLQGELQKSGKEMQKHWQKILQSHTQRHRSETAKPQTVKLQPKTSYKAG